MKKLNTINKMNEDDYDNLSSYNDSDLYLAWEQPTAISNPNLLINPNFYINQRLQEDYSSTSLSKGTYSVDRWLIPASKTGTAVTWTHDAIHLSSGYSIMQFIEDYSYFWGKIMTLTIATKLQGQEVIKSKTGFLPSSAPIITSTFFTTDSCNGITASLEYIYNATNPRFAVELTSSDSDTVIEWVKLELSPFYTQYTPPNPAEELLKCQRYFVVVSKTRSGSNYAQCADVGIVEADQKTYVLGINLPVCMRVKPSIQSTNGGTASIRCRAQNSTNSYYSAITPSSNSWLAITSRTTVYAAEKSYGTCPNIKLVYVAASKPSNPDPANSIVSVEYRYLSLDAELYYPSRI